VGLAVACHFACVAFMGNLFSLAGSAQGTLGVTYIPNPTQGATDVSAQVSVSPGLSLSQSSSRTQLSLNYGLNLAYRVIDTNAAVNGSRSTLVHRLTLNATRRLSSSTALSANVTGVAGQFDYSGLTAQLGSSTSSGAASTPPTGVAGATAGTQNSSVTTGSGNVPLQGASYKSLTGSLGTGTALSRRLNASVNADGSYADTDNPQVLGGSPQTQLGLGTGLSYALTANLRIQGNLRGNYIYGRPGPNRDSRLGVTGQLGTGLTLSRLSTLSLNAGISHTGPWFGVPESRVDSTLGVVVNSTYSQVLAQGVNGLGYSIGVNWSPAYDPQVDRMRQRVGLNAGLRGQLGADWSVSLNADLNTTTDKDPLPTSAGVDPAQETRLSLALPVGYSFTPWARMFFGANAYLPAPHLSLRFRLLNPAYSAFVGVRLNTPP
jgi:hypothetical protein